jgi:hypothetical protein
MERQARRVDVGRRPVHAVAEHRVTDDARVDADLMGATRLEPAPEARGARAETLLDGEVRHGRASPDGVRQRPAIAGEAAGDDDGILASHRVRGDLPCERARGLARLRDDEKPAREPIEPMDGMERGARGARGEQPDDARPARIDGRRREEPARLVDDDERFVLEDDGARGRRAVRDQMGRRHRRTRE